MQLPRFAFSVSAAFLIARSGWWIVFEQLSTVDLCHRVAFTVVVLGAIGALWEESIRWVNGLQPPLQSGAQPDDKPPTLLDLFKKDFSNTMKVSDEEAAISVTSKDGATINIRRQVYMDFPAKAKFAGFYIYRPSPPSADKLARKPSMLA
jgi:hypothetical protein